MSCLLIKNAFVYNIQRKIQVTINDLFYVVPKLCTAMRVTIIEAKNSY